MTQNKGRGLFANNTIYKNEIIIIEKPLAKAKIHVIENEQFSYNTEKNTIYMGQHSEIIKKC